MNKHVIVGAGIIGQLTALALHDRGQTDITLLEDRHAFPPASWAGGGILSPLFPWRYSAHLNRLCRQATQSYRGLVNRLEQAGRLAPGSLHLSGMWMQVPDQQKPRVRQWLADSDLPFEWQQRQWSGADHDGVFCPSLGSIRNPRLLKGLRGYLLSKGVRFEAGRVRSIVPGGGVNEVHTLNDRFAAEVVVLAAGAGMSSLVPEIEGMFPAKGEMLLYSLGRHAPEEIILTERGYAIPRADGATLFGSTLRVGDDTHYPTVAGRSQLEALAHMLVPATRQMSPSHHWAGVRPGSRRDYPLIGEYGPGLYLSTGHYRNGLVAAPASAELLASLIVGDVPPLDPTPYSPLSSSRSSSSFLRR